MDLESDDRRPVGEVDLIALAGVRRAQDALSEDLKRARPGLQVVKIGDALAPRNLLDAVAEGARTAMAWPDPDLSVELPSLVSMG